MVLVKKRQFFQIFILGNIGQKNAFYHIVEGRIAFVEFEKVEKLGFFPRGQAMVLVKTWQFFQVFILRKIGQKNVFYHIVEGRIAYVEYRNKNLKKSKNWDFSHGFGPWFWSKIGNFSRFLFQGKQARKVCFTIFWKEETPFQIIKTRS